jgi:hypothetical protein
MMAVVRSFIFVGVVYKMQERTEEAEVLDCACERRFQES